MMNVNAPLIDAEALYRVVRDRLQAALGDAIRSGTTALAGIHSGGAWIAERLARDLGASSFGVLNVALHRDDYAKKGLHSQAQPTSLPFGVEDTRIVLVDDVLFTGRTIRAAINELYDYGRPACIELAVLEVPVAQTLVLQRDVQGALAFVTEVRA